METIFKIRYTETQKHITDLFKLFMLYKNANSYKATIGIAGPCVYAFLIYLAKPTMDMGLVFFTLKFLSFWLAAFVIGDIWSKKTGKKNALINAEKTGFDLYNRRLERRGKPLEIEIDFYEDRFIFRTFAREEVYEYNEISRILETEDAFGVMIGNKLVNNDILNFPKDAMEKDEVEKFAELLKEKATERKKEEIIKIEY